MNYQNKHNRLLIWNKYGKHCAYCGKEIKLSEMQVDHLIPQEAYKIYDSRFKDTKPDKDDLTNLMPSCRVCNLWKLTFRIETFRFELSEQLKRLNERSTNYRIAKMYKQIQETPEPIVFYFETKTGTPPTI